MATLIKTLKEGSDYIYPRTKVSAISEGSTSLQSLLDDKLDDSNVKQATGTSTTDVMSQKATTDALNLKINASAVKQATGTSTTDIMSQKATSDALDTKLNTSNVKQVTGTSQTDVMSQKAVSDGLDTKINTSAVKQVTGTSTTDVMSQNAVSTEISTLKQNIKDGNTTYKVYFEIQSDNLLHMIGEEN